MDSSYNAENRLINLFKKRYNKKSSKKIILVEYFRYKNSLISYALLSNCLSDIYDAKIVSYNPNDMSLLQIIKRKLLDYLKKDPCEKIYDSFGAEKTIYPKLKKILKNKKYFFKDRESVINFSVKNILIGDLLYDEYLRSNNKPTIDINDQKFKSHVNHTLELFNYWYKYLKENNVKSVIISHPVYNMGIICRIAIKLKIPVYYTGPNGMYYLTSKYKTRHSTSHYKNYPLIFKRLKKILKTKLVNQSKKLLKDRFDGKHDLKLLLDRDTKNKFFDKKINYKKLNKNLKKSKIKILVQAQQLNDAPHVYDGKNIFVDFAEWLNFLGMISEKTDYEWLIKVHPSESKTNYLYFENLTKKYKNFRLLDSNTSNSEVINLGINAVTTVYGSVGHEFPIFGIPVINAGNNGPHSGYKFNYHAKSKKEYSELLINVNNLKVSKKDVKDIYEFYSIRNSMDFTPIYNQQKYVSKYGKNFYGSKFIDTYLKQDNNLRNLKINNDIKCFIKSKKFRMFYDFFDKKEPLIKDI